MKRKLIKRNKKFLSSRYREYSGGNSSFQRVTAHTIYSTTGDDMIFKPRRYKWRWFFKEDWLLGVLDAMNTDGGLHEILHEISKIDQELGLYTGDKE